MAGAIRVVHYLNQFFGQIGGEEQAQMPPRVVDGPVGPGRLLQEQIEPWGAIVATVIAGDSYMAENLEAGAARVIEQLVPLAPGLIMAGPAFAAGRYGLACGAVCRQARAQLGVPAVAGMDPGQPAVDMFRRDVLIAATGDSARSMSEALAAMAALGRKLSAGQPLGRPEAEGYIPQGIRKNVLVDRLAADRAVDMVLAKVNKQPFQTEIPLPVFRTVEPAPPLADLRQATVALITTGGIVPKGNPGRLESHVATFYGKVAIAGVADLDRAFEAHHGGYYAGWVDEDPDRMMPVDVLRDMEREGAIKGLFPYYYTMAGTGTYPEAAEGMARDIADDMKASGATAALLTST